MKIVCVSGGSYKSIYFNNLLKLKSCDLLVFNSNIIYDFVVKDELFGKGLVTKELIELSNKLNCQVVAVANVVSNTKQKSLIVCDGDKVYTSSITDGIKICIKGKCFFVGCKKTKFYNYNKIILEDERIYPIANNCSDKKIYLFVDKLGVSFIKNKTMKRIFLKFVEINLK